MPIQRSVVARTGRVVGLLSVLAAALASSVRAELPEQLQKQIDRARENYAEGSKAADKKLRDAFEAEEQRVRNQTGLKAETRLAVVEIVQDERAAFEKHGAIPFSPRMRTAAVAYVKALDQAIQPALQAYDRAIDHLTKVKDDATAATLVDEKKKMVTSKAIAKLQWGRAGAAGSWSTLYYPNGLTQHADVSWSFVKTQFVSTKRTKDAPGGAWIDNIVFDDKGMSFTAKNQKGFEQRGTVVYP